MRRLRINEVERLVGITKGNIRFYEKEGLLTPVRESGNGYRDYTDADVEALKQIKLLRKLDLPLAEIRLLQSGALTVGDAMGRHIIRLERQRSNLASMVQLCRELEGGPPQLAQVDAQSCLERMEEHEQKGVSFVNIKKRDVRAKCAGAIAAALAMVMLMAGLIAIMLWAFITDPEQSPPLALVIFFCAIPGATIVGTFIALVQRIRQIKGGEEEDAAAQY